jgi:hypothetical protein
MLRVSFSGFVIPLMWSVRCWCTIATGLFVLVLIVARLVNFTRIVRSERQYMAGDTRHKIKMGEKNTECDDGRHVNLTLHPFILKFLNFSSLNFLSLNILERLSS